MLLPEDYVVWDKELSLEDADIVGNEIASMGEFSHADVGTLPWLIITPYAFSYFKEKNNLSKQIKHLLGSLNHERHDSISQVASYLKKLIITNEIPQEIYKPLHKKIDTIKDEKLFIRAYFFCGKKIIKTLDYRDLTGDATVLDKVREIWSQIFSGENLASYKIHHNNHHEYNVCIAIFPEFEYSLRGHVKLNGKGEYELEANSSINFVFSKNTNRIEKAKVLEGGSKDALTVHEVKKLLDIAKLLERTFYLPQIAYWGKYKSSFLVTRILPSGEEIDYKDTFNSLTDSLTVSPGITIGKLRVIDESNGLGIVLNDEIVVLKALNKKMIDTIKRAKGIILDETPDPEIAESLRKIGIPALVRKHKTLLYSTGDVVSLNATTGEIKRGSMLVS